jgi:hypothetical protein
MKPRWVAWERAAEVREAARGWRRVCAIDDATRVKIDELFPDPRVTPSPVWRALTAGMVAAITLSLFCAFAIALGRGSEQIQVLLLLFAGTCLATAEVLAASPRFARRGAAGALLFLGIAFLLAGLGLVLVESARLRWDDAFDIVLLAAVVACGSAAWRWGSPFFAGTSCLALFCYLASLPHGRLLWLVVGAVAISVAMRQVDDGRRAPSHRRGAAVLTVVGIGAVYAAANVYSVDEQWLEQLARITPPRDELPRGAMLLASLATALIPPAVLAWGVKSNRTLLLDAGIVMSALSLITLRHYVHVAPLWIVLTLSGTVVVVLALAVERALRRAPGREIAGFTAEPLFSDERRQHALQLATAVGTLTPAPLAPGRDPGFAGEGGRFGGGGAQEKF